MSVQQPEVVHRRLAELLLGEELARKAYEPFMGKAMLPELIAITMFV